MEVKELHNDILDRNFVHDYRKGYVSVNGYVFPRTITPVLRRIADLEVFDSDVWVSSFPKSGTTWTQEMVWLLMNDLNFDKAVKTNLDERFPFVEFIGIYEDINQPDTVRQVEELSKPRCIKTHLPWIFLPNQIQNGSKKPKIIHVIRNPKDTCISYYHHVKLLEGFKGTFEEFCELFLTGDISYGPYWKCIESYWKHKGCDNVFFLRYEDMKKDLFGSIKRVSKFLGKTYSDGDVEKLCDHVSFDNMKRNPAVNKEKAVQKRRQLNISIEGDHFMRRGRVGDYKTMMDDSMEERFDVWIKENVKDIQIDC